jgi:ubiquinone/menaquinone biosynthesis C-methylase UbiE
MTDNDENWSKEAYGGSQFGRQYAADRLLDDKLPLTADFLIKSMDLKPGDRVFDQCCGGGPVSLALAQRGIEVVGIDQAEHAIAQAQRVAAERGLTRTFFKAADAFEYRTEQPCDAAINWSTSCGYSRDDDQNIKMFQRAFESLKPGGRFAVQYMNISDRDNFSFDGQPQEIDGQTVRRTNKISYDEVPGMSVSKWTYTYPDGHQEQLPASEMRAYSPDELKKLVEKAGFVDVSVRGDFDREPVTGPGAGQNVVVMARRPS